MERSFERRVNSSLSVASGRRRRGAGERAALERASRSEKLLSIPTSHPNKSWWVYLVRCADGTLYCGSTNDLEHRLAAHNAGAGARYTRGRGPVELVFRKRCPSRSAAQAEEARIKRLPRPEKFKLLG